MSLKTYLINENVQISRFGVKNYSYVIKVFLEFYVWEAKKLGRISFWSIKYYLKVAAELKIKVIVFIIL